MSRQWRWGPIGGSTFADVYRRLGGVPHAVLILVLQQEESPPVEGAINLGRRMALLFSDGQGIEDESCSFDSTGVSPTMKDGVALKVPVACFTFGVFEREERSDLLGRVFCSSELGECNEGVVVRVGIGVIGFREVLGRLVYGLALNFDVLVLGVAMLSITSEDLDYIGRLVECRNLH